MNSCNPFFLLWPQYTPAYLDFFYCFCSDRTRNVTTG